MLFLLVLQLMLLHVVPAKPLSSLSPGKYILTKAAWVMHSLCEDWRAVIIATLQPILGNSQVLGIAVTSCRHSITLRNRNIPCMCCPAHGTEKSGTYRLDVRLPLNYPLHWKHRWQYTFILSGGCQGGTENKPYELMRWLATSKLMERSKYICNITRMYCVGGKVALRAGGTFW